ncbi:hypothetical protein B0T16DRAFT_315840 [Cercophora newfieldiana]|uniref:Uncharacterized protein n=1 Tax=Cercophora newfieldiana TaxID=92897 RepID=A0AA39YPU8_9PEZI|nr:hypothetical protein B0T16DRAFT_315840 [Cercophora newfieldiana]
MAAIEAANPRQHHGHHQPHAPLPASPTLTNPDMILPEYERSVSPAPDLDSSGRDHSPLMMWKNAHAAASATDMHHMFGVNPSEQRLDHPYGPTGPITPTTPIIYGNGTMLSDIGEVTEVESTPGKPSPARNKAVLRRLESPTRGSGSDAALRSSPTMGVAAMLKKKSNKSMNAQRERRSSLESNSTITTEDQAALFADFDDTASVGDSVFQGDDEESMASSYVEGTPAQPAPRLGIPNTDSADRLSTYSTTSISRRAEEILANAKKRLTTMEGNLTRARSSLHITPPYGSDASTPSPPFQRASTAMYARDSSRSTPSPSHSRMSSEIAIRNGLPYRVTMPRSQSAMGSAGGYRQPLPLSKSADQIRGGTESVRPAYRVAPPRDSTLQPLTEDEVARLEALDEQGQESRMDNFLSPTFGSMSDNTNNGTRGLQRSASAAQMRDIKDQMKDLKGKISSLREQARVDSMKRRSLQSLRTPSPFTHSQIDQWYAEPPPNSDSATNPEDTARNPWNGEESSIEDGFKEEEAGNPRDDDDYADEESAYEDVEEVTQLRPADGHYPDRRSIPLPPAKIDISEQYDDDVVTENGDMPEGEELPEGFQDAVDLGYESESGDSLYHDTVQHQLSHEDREDAFDYEHFFLHSALGTMGHPRTARRGSTNSYTSEDSVETTRGPIIETSTNGADDMDDPTYISSQARRNSVSSISTIGTYATAEEDRSRRSVESNREVEAVTEGIFGVGRTPAESPPSSPRNRSDTTGTTKRSSVSTGSNNASMSSILSVTRDSDDSISSIPEEGIEDIQTNQPGRRISAFRRPISFSAAHSMHRPSVSSFDSTGTNRSFPLVNKPKDGTGILTPNSSPDQDLKTISTVLMTETASMCEQQQRDRELSGTDGVDDGLTSRPLASQPLQAMLREDKYLVERLVAGLGRCVLGLTENGRASTESRMYRRRIDAARRILEGLDLENEVV